MRLIIKLISKSDIPELFLNKYYVQSSIYSLFLGTNLSYIHDSKYFKFFTFSDFFPAGPFYPNKEKVFIISSPDNDLINFIYERLDITRSFYFYGYRVDVTEMKKFDIKKKIGAWQTGSPITLYKDNKNNVYFSFKRKDDIEFFLERLKENSIKKYRSFKNDNNFNMDGHIFDSMVLKKEVSMLLMKDEKYFNIIGSVWSFIKKSKIEKDYRAFYEFLFDAGLGEKNSLGFGFVNPARVDNDGK